MNPKNRVFTPIDFFVQTYAMDHPRDYKYNPGAELEFDTHMMSQEDIEELIEAVDKCGLRVQFNGQVFLYEPDEDEEPEEEPETPEDEEPPKFQTQDMTPAELRAEADRVEQAMKDLDKAREPVEEEPEGEEEAVEIEEELIPEVIRNLPQISEEEATEI